MKNISSIIAIVISICICLDARADYTNKLVGNPLSKNTPFTTIAANGLELSIENLRSGHLEMKDPMWLHFQKRTNSCMVFLPKDEYLARFTLLDANNHLIPKKDLCTEYQLITNGISWNKKDTRFLRRTTKGRSIMAEADNKWRSSPLKLPNVAELFEVSKPGTYKLRIEFQVFFIPDDGTNCEIARFPPMEIMVAR